MKRLSLGLEKALSITLEHIKPLAVESIQLAESTDRVAASDLYALVDCPVNGFLLKRRICGIIS